MLDSDCIEYTLPNDKYYNYCWWPYRPTASTEDKFRPVTLLRQSLAIANCSPEAEQAVRLIQHEIGLFRTVYGVKWCNGQLGWEYYLYDYARRERSVSITRVLRALQPLISCPIAVNESLPYFMFSIDMPDAVVRGQRPMDVVHMYVGNPGSDVSSGIAYAMRTKSVTLENFYFFFDAQRQLRQAGEKVFCSARIDAYQMDIEKILRPEFTNCHTICIANKQTTDTAYFSGVNVMQLLQFLKWLDYPRQMIAFVESQQNKLDHLLYDIGFDFVADGAELQVVKSGFYGVF
ncbi:MAG: hypothetical protein KDA87_12525 [Planctomycetales bacterium]|nr:hypothetical protein [Planctomycetales bacterium]